MKKLMKRAVASVLVLAICAGAGGALAYSTPDFVDVAPGNWAYDYVMQMADAGVIKGTSATTFEPETKVSAAMWLTLLGRATFEEAAQADAREGDLWYSAYVRVAEDKKLLEGTDIDVDAIEDEITRYDMAFTLMGALDLPGIDLFADLRAYTSKITDYEDVPHEYRDRVVSSYKLGLITGDEQGKFNGTQTMRRDEAAAVMTRLLEVIAKAEAGTLFEPTTPRTGETETFTIKGKTFTLDQRLNQYPLGGVSLTLHYKDGRELGRTVSKADGSFEITVTVDKADYTYTGNVYYFTARGTNPETGTEYFNSNSVPLNLFSDQNDWDVIMRET
jgi:hypothetical protein